MKQLNDIHLHQAWLRLVHHILIFFQIHDKQKENIS